MKTLGFFYGFKSPWVFLGFFTFPGKNFVFLCFLPKSKDWKCHVIGENKGKIWNFESMTKKGHQKFWRIKDNFGGKSWDFLEKSQIFQGKSWKSLTIAEKFDLGLSGFFLLAHLGFFIFPEWQRWFWEYVDYFKHGRHRVACFYGVDFGDVFLNNGAYIHKSEWDPIGSLYGWSVSCSTGSEVLWWQSYRGL